MKKIFFLALMLLMGAAVAHALRPMNANDDARKAVGLGSEAAG